MDRQGAENRLKELTQLPEGIRVTDWLMSLYTRLNDAYGDLKWWPADTVEEMVIGAILVQNVSWRNTEKALHNLRLAGLLRLTAIAQAPTQVVGQFIVPTRFFNMKAKRLKAFADHVMSRHDGSLDALLAQPMELLRKELLSIPGIGPETADDIVLYGANHPSFVIDTYTKRILGRCNMIPASTSYADLRNWFMHHLPPDTALFNQFHALFDRLGNSCCQAKKPKCDACPITDLCQFQRLRPREDPSGSDS